jgi:hypothetical protein
MDVQTVVANVLTFNTNTFVRPALQGFSDADLLKRPSEESAKISGDSKANTTLSATLGKNTRLP